MIAAPVEAPRGRARASASADVEYGPIPTRTPCPSGARSSLAVGSGRRPGAARRRGRRQSADGAARGCRASRSGSARPRRALACPVPPVPAGPGWRDELRTDYRARAVAGIGAAGHHQPGASRARGRSVGRRLRGSRRPSPPPEPSVCWPPVPSGSAGSRRSRSRRLGVLGPALRDVLRRTVRWPR